MAFHGTDAPRCQYAPHFGLGVSAAGKFLPCPLEEAENWLGRLVRLCLFLAACDRALVSERRSPREDSVLDFPPHPLHCSHCPNVVIELSEARENGFHEFSFGLRVNRFRN